MKRYLVATAAGLLLAAGGTRLAAAQDVPPPGVLPPPAGNVLAFSLTVDGDRVYVCEAGSGGQFAWAERGPDAALLNRFGEPVGRYTPGPTWTAGDGSSMQGQVVQSTDGPRQRSTPWLLLRTASRGGNGIFGGVDYAQEVQTHGGLPPTEPCTQSLSGQERRVDFNALHHFYIPSPANP